MVLRAMFSGVSGLRAEGEAIGVIGDNIANVNTVGFKSQRVLFQDVLGHSILAGTASALPGAGVRLADVQAMFTQGSLINTGVATDLGLSGDGFFVVNGSTDGLQGDFYTRAGQMHVDNDGYLVNPVDMRLQGYAADANGVISASVGDLQVPTASLPARATTEIDLTLNLDASDTVLGVAFDPLNAGTTSNFSSSIVVNDSLGTEHAVDFFFVKIADNTWEFHVLADGGDIVGGTAGVPQEIGSASSLVFDTNGALQSGSPLPYSFDFAGGSAPAQSIALDFGDDIANDGASGLGGTTQFSADASVSALSQDGYSSGDFTGVAIDGQGLVQGFYTNGQRITVGQLAIAKFRNNDGLSRAGNGLFIDTTESGVAALGTAASGGRASVSGGALEQSNVDLAEQFVGLIQHQRAFSANSRTITTADEMLQELINIKR